MKKRKICHITSVHSVFDVRIFYKECGSLSNAGYEVYLVAPEILSQIKNGIQIIGVPNKPANRFYRILFYTKHIYKNALLVNADIYHLHDPELIPFGLMLKKKGKIVVFDSHEDVPNQILSKKWIPLFLRKSVSFLYTMFEHSALSKFDALVSVTPILTKRLLKINLNTYQITNYPIINEYIDNRIWNRSLCFAGGITRQWLHVNVISSFNYLPKDISYNLAGNIDPIYMSHLSMNPNWRYVSYKGCLPQKEVNAFLQKSSIGMALNEYSPNVGYKTGSIGNTKLFEYMSAGIPVVCTDFVLWKEIVYRYKCGICVNPYNTFEIANAIKYLLDNPSVAREMGNNGRKAVEKEFNWKMQEEVLLQMYKDL